MLTNNTHRVELLREVHHRVKNNTQLMVSLVNVVSHSREFEPDTRELLQNIARRIRAISSIQDYLYDSPSMERINFSRFIRKAISELQVSHPESERIHIELSLQEEVLTVDKAIACAIIIHELVTNALRHAFDPSEPDSLRKHKETIQLSFSVRDGQCHLCLQDNGQGISLLPDSSPAHTDVGLHLVSLLVDEYLQGEIRYASSEGTRIQIIFDHQGADSYHNTALHNGGRRGDALPLRDGFARAWELHEPLTGEEDCSGTDGVTNESGEIGVLLDEVYHRQLKNMRIILTILQKARRLHIVPAHARGIDRAHQAIQTLFNVHQNARFLSGVEYVNFAELLRQLLSQYFSSPDEKYPQNITIQARCQAIPKDQAVPLALLSNELFYYMKSSLIPGKASNKRRGPKAHLFFRRRRKDKIYELVLFDRGLGILPEQGKWRNQTYGLGLIAAIARDQLGGRICHGTDSFGSSVTIRFPVIQS